jgi:hypothetical protein
MRYADTRPGSSVVSDTGLAWRSTTVTAGFDGAGAACLAQPAASNPMAPRSSPGKMRFSAVKTMCRNSWIKQRWLPQQITLN